MKRVVKFKAKDYKGNWQVGTYYFGVMYPTSFAGHYVNDTLIDEKTLCQFAGKIDKNGKEIFESDICSTYNIDKPSNLVDTVVFDEGSFVFQNDYKLSAELRGFKTDYIEIIGNIHDLPENEG